MVRNGEVILGHEPACSSYFDKARGLFIDAREDKISESLSAKEILQFLRMVPIEKRALHKPGEEKSMRMMIALILALLPVTANAQADDAQKNSEWKQLWDGKTFEGWKASENVDSWKIENGTIICDGPRSHLFYVGDDQPFKNFEFECEVKTEPHSNAGIYFHTKYQETGWPKYGYEVQVNVTHQDPKKSGGLYATADVSDPPIKDGEWYTQTIIVKDRHVISKINGKTVADYVEPEGKKPFSAEFERRLGEGTFAFQAHDPESKVSFRNIRVKRLP